MVLLLAIHSVEAATASLPFNQVILLGEHPNDSRTLLQCRASCWCRCQTGLAASGLISSECTHRC